MSSNGNGAGHVDPETQEMLRSFVSEAFDSLDTNEPIVEDLGKEENEESVNAIFRVFHTLKGLSGFFEMYVINRVTHEAETLLDFVRKENKPQSEATITVVYQAFDFLRDLLQRVNTEYSDESGEQEADDMILIIKDQLNKIKSGDSGAPESSAGEEASETAGSEPAIDAGIDSDIDPAELLGDDFFDDDEEIEASGEETEEDKSAATEEKAETKSDDDDIDVTSLISDEMFDQYLTNATELLDISERNLLDLEKNPSNADLVQETFGAIHSLKGNSGFMGFSEVEELSMEIETILDSVRSGDLEIDQNLTTILLSNLETIRNRVESLANKEEELKKDIHEEESVKPEVKTEPKEEPVVDEEPKEEIIEEPVADKKPEKKVAEKEPPKKEPEKPKPAPKKKPAPPAAARSSANAKLPAMQRKDIRVETSKIDRLFDLVGELITIETMVTKNPDLKGLNLPNFNKSANMFNKITRDLQEISMSIRMMPLEGQFNKMKRLVRDVSIKMGKKVNFTVSGQETEMDKNVIDEIADPLVHILRNSIDHGIETPEERLASGKPEIGNVFLGARYEGNEILISVKDDGAGLDRDKIIAKAEERGILNVPPESMSDREVYQLIFEPGFSTAKQVTDISGRGVGMDVVRKNIEKLRGAVQIESDLGNGTTITMRIPLTLAIMEAMLIRIGSSIFALPILAIRQSFRPTKKSITVTMDGLEVVRVRDEIFPIVRLHEVYDKRPTSNSLTDGILIIVEAQERKVCLFADEIVGQQQAVIKGLSDYIGKVDGITGCMVLGDGGIGLIIDIESLIDLSQKPEYSERDLEKAFS